MIANKFLVFLLLALTKLSLGNYLTETSNCAFDVKGVTSTNINMNIFRLKNNVKSGFIDLRKNAYIKKSCNNRPIGVITLACDDPRNSMAPEIVTTFNNKKDAVKIKRVSETFIGETEIQIFVYCEESVDIDNY